MEKPIFPKNQAIFRVITREKKGRTEGTDATRSRQHNLQRPLSMTSPIPIRLRTALLQALRVSLAGFIMLPGLFAPALHARLSSEDLNDILLRNGFNEIYVSVPPAETSDGKKVKSLGTAVKRGVDPDSKAAGEVAEKTSASLDDELRGMGFGPGIGVFTLSGARPVESAVVDSGNVVRIESKSKMRTGAIFEAHWLVRELPDNDEKSAVSAVVSKYSKTMKGGETSMADRNSLYSSNHISWGPMATVEIGGENAIRSFGLGLIASFQHYRVTGSGIVKRSGAFNLGALVFAEPNVKSIVGDYTDGQVVPAGTTISTQDEHRFGYGIVFSTRF